MSGPFTPPPPTGPDQCGYCGRYFTSTPEHNADLPYTDLGGPTCGDLCNIIARHLITLPVFT